jgi:hypothetical protein
VRSEDDLHHDAGLGFGDLHMGLRWFRWMRPIFEQASHRMTV